MMIRKAFLLKLFDAAYLQRWNDKVKPVEFVELDKQAHKMIIAFFLGKFDENTPGFDWTQIIEGGIFELIQRIVVTDLKPPIFYKIKENQEQYRKLNEWVCAEIEPILSSLGPKTFKEFREYFASPETTINRRILMAAHIYASRWEFSIIERANPEGFEIDSIRNDLMTRLASFGDLSGMKHIERERRYMNFIDFCGQLRFQSRWSNLHRIPKTSVIGHSLLVAILSYLFSREAGACKMRRINNYFTGLFHDLPEVLTRDIISPVKRSVAGLLDLIKEYEREQMEREVYGLIPVEWHPQIRMYTENEFESSVVLNGQRQTVSSADISERYNEDRFDPKDGELVRAVDQLAAFIEAYAAIQNGSPSPGLQEAKLSIRNTYARATVAGVNFGEIYADFE